MKVADKDFLLNFVCVSWFEGGTNFSRLSNVSVFVF